MENKKELPQVVRVVDTGVNWEIGDELIHAVITAAVWSVERKPGTWQRMIEAANRGAAGTKEGTVNAFLFRAMVERLLEEFRGVTPGRSGKPPTPPGCGRSTGGTPCL